MNRLKKAAYVGVFAIAVGVSAVLALNAGLPIGPVILALGSVPVAGLLLARRRLARALPDVVFGALDTGLLTIPALWGGLLFGVAGAIAGGVVGDALTDAVAGFFEGSIEEWLEERGIGASREAVTTALGKMTGCLLGSGLVLSVALLFGIEPRFDG
jgi:hypothetical protein